MAMFARWAQENFFKYVCEHFSLDRLVDYRTEAISDALQMVNPDYRHLDGNVRSATGKLTHRLAKFAAMTIEEPIEPKHVEPFVRRKAALQEEIETLRPTPPKLICYRTSRRGPWTVRLHHAANVATDRVLEKLRKVLNATATIFPRTNLRLALKLGST